MTPKITAIETFYGGCRFRSRLEARWAVFFDALRIKWEYEPEGFRLSDGTCYLPDFWLPAIGVFAEVKPLLMSNGDFLIPRDSCWFGDNWWMDDSGNSDKTPYGMQWTKPMRLAIDSGKPVLLLHGEPRHANYELPSFTPFSSGDEAFVDWIRLDQGNHPPLDSSDLRDAVTSARSARFGT